MADLAPLSTGITLSGAAGVQPVATGEARLPRGRPLDTVQPHPTPMVSPQAPAQPEPDENTRRMQAAQTRADMTGAGGTNGLGALVDIRV